VGRHIAEKRIGYCHGGRQGLLDVDQVAFETGKLELLEDVHRF
jgi:hypothetical protein